MHLHQIDWTILLVTLFFLILVVFFTRNRTRSVSDFLAANRSAGRYIICIGDGIAGLGAITVLAYFEMYYNAGFAIQWWAPLMGPVGFIIAISGWVVYRFRETRALTMGQFFEIRYSRKFRIFAGMLSYVSGVINFGIFPAVGARFFIHYGGLPVSLPILGFDVPTFPLVMAILLAVSVFFVFVGGQVTVLVADFVQGTLCAILFLVIIFVILLRFDLGVTIEALNISPEGKSMINPFDTGSQKDFNVWYIVIMIFYMFYTHLAFQGQQGYNTSAKNPHEARMAKILATWRSISQGLMILLLALGAYAFLNHPEYFSQAEVIKEKLLSIDNEQIRKQMTVPLALSQILPKGMIGAFLAVMLAAFISTHDTYLHSWGSILIQDVILPIRKKPLSPKAHILLLRCSIIGVAIFIFFFSLLFRQTEYIFMFFLLTGAIFFGGAGSVIIGGLYWKRASTLAAWTALIVGSTSAVAGIVIKQICPDLPINGQVFMFISFILSIISYVAVSLLGPKCEFNLDKLLHRGKYAIVKELTKKNPVRYKILKILGMTEEFTKGDKIIFALTLCWTMSWFFIFVIGSLIYIFKPFSDLVWATYWKCWVYINLGFSIVTTVWIGVGGVINLKQMFRSLSKEIQDETDDGRVE